MCLACELDALWYDQWEQLAAERAGEDVPVTAGVPPALSNEPPGAADIEGAGASLQALTWGEAAGVPANAGGTPALRAVSRFRCEEAE